MLVGGSHLSRTCCRSPIYKAFSSVAPPPFPRVFALRVFNVTPLASNCLLPRLPRIGVQTRTNFRSFSFCNVRLNTQIDAKSTKLPDATKGGAPSRTTAREQRRKDWTVVRKLMENVWPKDDWGTRGRVILGFTLLITGKVWPPYFQALLQGTQLSRKGVERTSPSIVQERYRYA